MADKYPLGITLVSSIVLEGAMQRYRNVLPEFSDEELEFVHEWNNALKTVIQKSKYKEKFGMTGKLCVSANPVLISKILDKATVPYRSYYYAKRFLEAKNFVSQKCKSSGQVNIVDFGRGLSPWCHVVQQQHPNIELYTVDMPITDAVFAETTKQMGLTQPRFNQEPYFIDFDKDMFVSLGTFEYLLPSEQVSKIRYVSDGFKNMFIELEKEDVSQSDKNVIKLLGNNYNHGWNNKKVHEVLGDALPYSLKPVASIGDKKKLLSHKYDKLLKSVCGATEMFLVR